MKQLLVILSVVFCISSTSAQIAINTTCPGFKIGFNASNALDLLEFQGNNAKPGISAYFVVDHLYRENYSMNFALGYSQKGYKSAKYGSLQLNYLEIPLNIQYKVGYETQFTLHGGVYVAAAINGNRKYYAANTTELNPDLTKEKLTFGFSAADSDIRPIDYGAQIGCGLETQYGMFAQIQAGYGFYNLTGVPDHKLNNVTFSLSLGYYFAY